MGWLRDAVKARVTMHEVLSWYGIDAHSGNSGAAMIRCPFHDDATPSMRVTDHSARCYANCLEEGWVDEIGFVMKKEGLDFRGALHLMAGRLGIPVESEPGQRDVQAEMVAARVRRLLEPPPIPSLQVHRELILASSSIHQHLQAVPEEDLEREIYEAVRLGNLLDAHAPGGGRNNRALRDSVRQIIAALPSYWQDRELPIPACVLRFWEPPG